MVNSLYLKIIIQIRPRGLILRHVTAYGMVLTNRSVDFFYTLFTSFFIFYKLHFYKIKNHERLKYGKGKYQTVNCND